MMTELSMNKIKVEHQPDPAKLIALGVFEWGIWEKEESEFPWLYDAEETCYLLEGEVIVTSDDGISVKIEKGDLVVFPAGLSCHWKIIRSVRKHYNFA